MSHLPILRPPASPSCWGKKYQDGDVECSQCSFNDTCKKEVLRGAMYAPFPVQPVYTQQTVPFPRPVTNPPMQSYVAPLPQHPVTSYGQNIARPAPIPQAPVPPPAYSYQAPPSYQNYQAPPSYQNYQPLSLNPYNPGPNAIWSRPGATAPPYHFNQHIGEGTTTRLGKNILLAALAALALELFNFFMHWAWAPSKA